MKKAGDVSTPTAESNKEEPCAYIVGPTFSDDVGAIFVDNNIVSE